MGIKLTPQWFLQSLRIPFLKMGRVNDSCHNNGICSCFQMSRIGVVSDFIHVLPPILRRTGESSSRPAAFLDFNNRIRYSTSPSDERSIDTPHGIAVFDTGVTVLVRDVLNCSLKYSVQRSSLSCFP
ncbi:hypothetical protein D915_010761 [Fasciola hepatica]|uniref:Uncharacterized protein n=1 Tax=Fasciola hepatica TaxID=6192 RepID=A0A4E0QU04_FASHE|nr:hypothetical protein D915_010761 [Fasciola hepatica]